MVPNRTFSWIEFLFFKFGTNKQHTLGTTAAKWNVHQLACDSVYRSVSTHGPLTRYINCELFSLVPTSKETISQQSLHASQHVRDARAVINAGIAGKTFLAFPVHAQPTILCIWQEAHNHKTSSETQIHTPYGSPSPPFRDQQEYQN